MKEWNKMGKTKRKHKKGRMKNKKRKSEIGHDKAEMETTDIKMAGSFSPDFPARKQFERDKRYKLQQLELKKMGTQHDKKGPDGTTALQSKTIAKLTSTSKT
mgnify:CR=1 FL=1